MHLPRPHALPGDGGISISQTEWYGLFPAGRPSTHIDERVGRAQPPNGAASHGHGADARAERHIRMAGERRIRYSRNDVAVPAKTGS